MGRTSDSKEKLMKAVTELIWVGSYGSTTIDRICERARVNKGTFYHFFDSKATLAEEAIQSEWKVFRKELDAVFSASLPPLERIHRYCQFEYQFQVDLKKQYGFALGCPLSTLGTEVSTLEPDLRKTVNHIMDQARKYFESTIRDAHGEKVIHAPNAFAKSQTIYAYIEGLLMQMRIQDNVDILKEMEGSILDILGVSSVTPPRGETSNLVN